MFVIAEALAVLGVALVAWPEMLPVAIPLVVVASITRWIRKRSWGELWHGGGLGALVGAGAGAVAIVGALVAGAPLVEAATGRAVEWSTYPIVRGNTGALVSLALYVAIAAVAMELALRGWIVERVLELGGHRVIAVLVGGIAEAIVTPGHLEARLGAGVFGLGLGVLFVAGGRSVVAPICARVVFALGTLVLEAARLVG